MTPLPLDRLDYLVCPETSVSGPDADPPGNLSAGRDPGGRGRGGGL
jgi:hypothetical protein